MKRFLSPEYPQLIHYIDGTSQKARFVDGVCDTDDPVVIAALERSNDVVAAGDTPADEVEEAPAPAAAPVDPDAEETGEPVDAPEIVEEAPEPLVEAPVEVVEETKPAAKPRAPAKPKSPAKPRAPRKPRAPKKA